MLWTALVKVLHEYSSYEAWNIGDGTTAGACNDCRIPDNTQIVDLVESIPDDVRLFNVAKLMKL
ncbi:hypothetical protein A2U01_0082037, partial [Trifolium medium]|nr:hypothetical protein [Trifolium medium]